MVAEAGGNGVRTCYAVDSCKASELDQSAGRRDQLIGKPPRAATDTPEIARSAKLMRR